MDVRIPHDVWRGLILALIVPAFLAGCTSTPKTSYDWGVNTRLHHRTRVAQQTHAAPQKTYSRSDTSSYSNTANPRVVPKPRPEPGWYQDSARRPPRVAENNTPAPVQTNIQFAWPVKGQVLSNFGSTTGGERNDGINIAASYGEPIHAAADGTVSYSGNAL
ncbi:MAG TPA: hypothetical protein VGC27_04000, partial [Rhizomicrobium sp.]